MFRIDKDLNISLVQGDTVNFRIDIKRHNLVPGDKVCFIIYGADRIVFRQDMIDFQEGYAYFALTPTQTYSFPHGLKYAVRLSSGEYRTTIIQDKNFDVKRGFELC